MAEEQKQRLFIEQLKQVIEERAAKKGSPVTCHITTMGCQMNARDSEKLSGFRLGSSE